NLGLADEKRLARRVLRSVGFDRHHNAQRSCRPIGVDLLAVERCGVHSGIVDATAGWLGHGLSPLTRKRTILANEAAPSGGPFPKGMLRPSRLFTSGGRRALLESALAMRCGGFVVEIALDEPDARGLV